MVKRRGKGEIWHIRFRKDNKELWVATNTTLKREAERIEQMVKHFVRTGDLTYMDHESRMVCVRLYRNQGWELPDGLINPPSEEPIIVTPVQEELTLWRAMQLCLKYPDVRNSANRDRHEQAFIHLVEKWGKEYPVESLWIPQIKEYQIERLAAGAKASTVNKEKAALSKVFQVLIELQHVDANPARMVKDLSEKTSERQVYLSFQDYQKIIDLVPTWLRPIIQTAYYTGMRRGEILSLTGSRIKLDRRMILLGPEDTKEGQWKRVPIHRDLVYILKEVVKVRSLSTSKIFLIKGRTPHSDSIRKPWNEAVKAIKLDPSPVFHDLRHTWKTNARRSGMDMEMREAIMGHGDRTRSVRERYGHISDQELLKAIDTLTFNHGKTEIWLSSQK